MTQNKKKKELSATWVPGPPIDIRSSSMPPTADWNFAETNGHVDLAALAKHIAKNNKDSKACLVALVGVDLGSVIPLDQGEVRVGRSPDCDVTLEDDSVSRFHATIVGTDDGHFVLTDLSSTNGSFVGDEQISSIILKDGDRVVLGKHSVFKFVFQDSMEINYQRLLYESSTRDALTGMYNRKYVEQKLTADLSFARRHDIPFTFFLLDLDLFKRVNDTYGHPTGDLTLTTVAKALLRAIRTEDVLGRFGGEEFAILSLGTHFEGAQRLGERIRETVEKTIVHADDDLSFNITVSLGGVTVEKTVAGTFEVIALADDNLYRAKDGGRNRAVCSLFVDDSES